MINVTYTCHNIGRLQLQISRDRLRRRILLLGRLSFGEYRARSGYQPSYLEEGEQGRFPCWPGDRVHAKRGRRGVSRDVIYVIYTSHEHRPGFIIERRYSTAEWLRIVIIVYLVVMTGLEIAAEQPIVPGNTLRRAFPATDSAFHLIFIVPSLSRFSDRFFSSSLFVSSLILWRNSRQIVKRCSLQNLLCCHLDISDRIRKKDRRKD